MSAYYLDTSALVKRYAHERGSSWVVQLTDPAAGDLLYTVRLTGPEMIAALFRKASMGVMTPPDAHHAAALFRLDWEYEYRVIEVSPRVTTLAMAMAEKYTLRGYDAVHLAAALEARAVGGALLPLTFISADAEQLRAAVAEGLPVDDPSAHP